MKALSASVLVAMLATAQTSLFPETVPDWMERLGWMLVHSVWQLAAVSGVAALMLRSMRHRSADARYAVSVAALAVMVALPCVTATQIAIQDRAPVDSSPLALLG